MHLLQKKSPRRAPFALDFLKVRFCGSSVGRKMDFSHLQRTKSYRPDFRSAVCPVAAIISNRKPSYHLTSFSWKPAQVLTLDHGIKMNVREAINFGLKKVNFENIRENQRNVVEAYLSGRDVLMISPIDKIRKKSYLAYRAVCDRFLQTWLIVKEMIFRQCAS